MHLNKHLRSLSHHSWAPSCDQIWSCATSALKWRVHSERGAAEKIQVHKPIKHQEEKVSLQPSTAVLHSFLKTVLPKQLKSQNKWFHWWSALKSDFQNRLLGDISYLGDTVAHCWVILSEERPSDKFSKSCHQTAKKYTSNGISPEHDLQRTWKSVTSYSHMDGNWPLELFWLKRCLHWEILGWHLFQRKKGHWSQPQSVLNFLNFPWENGLALFSCIRSSHGQCKETDLGKDPLGGVPFPRRTEFPEHPLQEKGSVG